MKKVIAYTGGNALGNPGSAAAGVYIEDDSGALIKEVKIGLGNGTAQFAEYYSVMLALQTLKDFYGKAAQKMQFEIRLDSEPTKKQLNAEAEINDPGLVPMFMEIHNLRVSTFPKLTLTAVSLAENERVQQLVAEVLAGR